MTQHLIAMALGPVQAFIATARRSRDLRYGSWWLSELSKAAARAITEQEEQGLEALVFPAPTQPVALKAGSPFNVGNKIVAVIEKPPAAIAQQAHEAVLTRLEVLWHQAQTQIKGPLTNSDQALAQIRSLPEFYWVAVAFKQGEYDWARRRADALLAARKSLRDFAPPTWADTVPKSSLSGVFESVIPESAYNDVGRLFTQYGARSAERLSAVDLLKRRGSSTAFPSTSHLAALPYLDRLQKLAEEGVEKQQKLHLEWDRYYTDEMQNMDGVRQTVTPEKHSVVGKADGSLLFESRLDDILEDQSQVVIDRAKERLIEFLDAVNGLAETKIRPQPYYALLMGDGDYMGREIEKRRADDEHREFSRQLVRFSTQVEGIVQSNKGALIYAGGDDVLAFLPLHTALKCASELAEAFHNMMFGLTFSAGIAIAHHLEPLADTLALARSAEKRAKAVPDKNALAISLDKRSGVTRTIAGHWVDMVPHLRQLAGWLQAEAVPAGTAYHLQSIVQELGGKRAIETHGLKQVLVHEFTRIIGRRQAQRGRQSNLDDEVKSELRRHGEGDATTSRIISLIDELIVANELARAATLAGVDLSQQSSDGDTDDDAAAGAAPAKETP